ncbi:MAG: adenosylcobinamide amidohydrolase [Rhodoblastus sp.]
MPKIPTGPLAIECDPPFLIVRLPTQCRTFGWSLSHPGFADASTIAWLEVRNADLTRDVDPLALLQQKLRERGLADAVAFMTSRDVRRHHLAMREVEGLAASCLATVGLANGESVGRRRHAFPHAGTINTLVHVSRRLAVAACIEAISIIAEARTVALIDTAALREGPRLTGTGTDCIVLAAPLEGETETCAGLHTALGEAIGGAVYDAVFKGAEIWSADMREDFAASKSGLVAPPP